MHLVPKFPPIRESFSAGDVQRLIQDAIHVEVDKRMQTIREATQLPSDMPIPKSAVYAGPSDPFSHPALHEPSSSSSPVVRDGRLNLAPPGKPTVHPGLKPRGPSVPRLTPRVPEVKNQDEDDEGDGFIPRTLGECMSDAYNFGRNFHKGGITRFHRKHGRMPPPNARLY